MKPSTLRPGMQVRSTARADAPVLIFIAREPSRRQSVLRSEAYAGQNGPDDDGRVVVSDYDMSRKFERVAG